MTGSLFAKRLDDVQADLSQTLKPLGFRRTGRTFNRATEDGVVQVVALQMWPAPIAERRNAVGDFMLQFMPGLYGSFTVNLGVYFEETRRYEAGVPHRKTIRDGDCTVRTRLEVLYEAQEFYWSLKRKVGPVVDDVRLKLLDRGLAYLDRFASRTAMVEGWIAFNDDSSTRTSLVARIDVALILVRQGDKAGAKRLLEEHVSLPTYNRNHAEYVRGLAREIGVGELDTNDGPFVG